MGHGADLGAAAPHGDRLACASDGARGDGVEVTFTAEGDGTRVQVEHRGWERLGLERGQEARDEYAAEDGWPFVLGCYEAAAR